MPSTLSGGYQVDEPVFSDTLARGDRSEAPAELVAEALRDTFHCQRLSARMHPRQCDYNQRVEHPSCVLCPQISGGPVAVDLKAKRRAYVNPSITPRLVEAPPEKGKKQKERKPPQRVTCPSCNRPEQIIYKGGECYRCTARIAKGYDVMKENRRGDRKHSTKEKVYRLEFTGDSAATMEEFGKLSRVDGHDPAENCATVCGLLLSGDLSLKKKIDR